MKVYIGGLGMENFEKIENDFYISKYGLPRIGDSEEIWKSIRSNIELLKWAREFYNIDGEPIQYKKSPRKKRRVNNGKLL